MVLKVTRDTSTKVIDTTFLKNIGANLVYPPNEFQQNTIGYQRVTAGDLRYLAPRVGFEPTTNRLTVDCSTTELPGNGT
jgi:hypothetical protein